MTDNGKTRARTPDEIVRDLHREREQLVNALDGLADDAHGAAQAASSRAKTVAPALAAAVAAALLGGVLLRRRWHRRGAS